MQVVDGEGLDSPMRPDHPQYIDECNQYWRCCSWVWGSSQVEYDGIGSYTVSVNSDGVFQLLTVQSGVMAHSDHTNLASRANDNG